MENRYFSNNATTTISSLSGNTLVVASAAKLPSQYPYFLTLENTALTREIVKVTASPSANTLTIVRAQEGTTQFAFAAGDKVELRVTAGTLNGLNDKVERSGDTLTGTLRFKDGGNGGVEIRPSVSTTSTGHVHLTDGSNNSIMFFGATPSSGGFITSQPNATTSNFSISVPTTQVTGEQLLLTTQSDGKTRVKIGSEFIPRCFSTGYPLPTVNIGPIWHDDYQDWMIWQTFNQNGANYVGYASVNIGKIGIIVGIKKGYVDTGTMNLSKTTYAALWNWAVYNGFIPYTWIFSGRDWNQDDFIFKDNGDGTFRVPHMGERFLKNVNKSYPSGTAGTAYGGYFLAAFNSDDGDSSSGSYRSYTGVALQGNNGRQTYFASDFGAGGWTPDMRVDIIGNVEPKHVNASFMIKF